MIIFKTIYFVAIKVDKTTKVEMGIIKDILGYTPLKVDRIH
jgi:hypothetical protein